MGCAASTRRSSNSQASDSPPRRECAEGQEVLAHRNGADDSSDHLNLNQNPVVPDDTMPHCSELTTNATQPLPSAPRVTPKSPPPPSTSPAPPAAAESVHVVQVPMAFTAPAADEVDDELSSRPDDPLNCCELTGSSAQPRFGGNEVEPSSAVTVAVGTLSNRENDEQQQHFCCREPDARRSSSSSLSTKCSGSTQVQCPSSGLFELLPVPLHEDGAPSSLSSSSLPSMSIGPSSRGRELPSGTHQNSSGSAAELRRAFEGSST
jgi:hypothetical protein